MDDHELSERLKELSENLRIRLDRLPPDECYYCGAEIDENPENYHPWVLKKHIEHVYPKSKGGTDDLENLVPACIDCNRAKNTMTPEEWKRLALSFMMSGNYTGFGKAIVTRLGEVQSIEDLNKWLALAMNIWNTTPQPDRGGKSAYEISRESDSQSGE